SPRRGRVLGARRLLRGLHRDARIVLKERELVALGVDASREPALGRDCHLVVGFAAKLADLGDRGVDVVGVEVHDRPRLLSIRVYGAARTRAVDEVVLHARYLRVLLLPSEARAETTLCAP